MKLPGNATPSALYNTRMDINGTSCRSIELGDDGWSVHVIDQRKLPHEFAVLRLTSLTDAAGAIRTMAVRGAPLIGATAAYGICLALRADATDASLDEACRTLRATRPTAVNLRWALERMQRRLREMPGAERVETAYAEAAAICDEDVATNRAIGEHGLTLLQALHTRKTAGEPLRILTHCNAGRLAAVDWGTALAPVYLAHHAGIPVHVWVDETRPRNQGALTAWELAQSGVPHTVIVDNAGGHLMQHGLVDCCIVGSDRTTAAGDVCNKIGTYLKALAAHDNAVTFYVALPGSTIDWSISDGLAEIPIEERDAREVTHVSGRSAEGRVESVGVFSDSTRTANYAFDITPSRLVTALITERGICPATREGLASLYPEHREARAAGR